MLPAPQLDDPERPVDDDGAVGRGDQIDPRHEERADVCDDARARRCAEREAIYFTLEAFGLVIRTRGGRPLPGPNSEGER